MSALVAAAAPAVAVAGGLALMRAAANLPPTRPSGRTGAAPMTALVLAGRVAVRVFAPWRRQDVSAEAAAAALLLDRDTRLGRLLARAHREDTGMVVRGLQVAAAVTGGGVAVALVIVAGPGVGPSGVAGVIAAPPAVAAALRRSVAAARRRLLDQAPVALDVMAAVVGAGGALDSACRRAASAVDGPCAAVLRRAALRAAAGLTAAEALVCTADEAGVGALSAVFSGLARDVQLGVATAPRLARAADALRSDRVEAARLHAARGSVVATLVTALVIAPACTCVLLVLALGGVLSQGVVSGAGTP